MSCRFCGAAIPQGMVYCPACKQLVFLGPGNAQGPSFPPPPTSMPTGYRTNQQMPAPYERLASPSVPSSPSPQMPDNTYAPQTSTAGGSQPHTENLTPTPFAQPGTHNTPAPHDQSWPAPFTQAPGQPFPNSFPPAQPYQAGPAAPQTQPFVNKMAFPAPGLSSSPSSAGFPQPAQPERNSEPWAAPTSFNNNTARPHQAEASSRFLYGPSASGSFPFNASGPSAPNAPAPATPSTPGQGFPFAPPTNPPEAASPNLSGRLSSAIISPSRKRRSPASTIGIITLLVVLAIGGIAAVVEFTNGGFNTTSTNSIFVQTTIPLAGATPVVGPSGQKVTNAASSVIINAQTASTLNSNYIPTQTTTSFATNQTIYTSLVINSNHQNGYIMIKWYANNQLLSTDNLAHNAKDTIAFFTQKYSSPTAGSAEIYWCTRADCSDAQLARVVHFTVHQ
jgi:hypothetical protein